MSDSEEAKRQTPSPSPSPSPSAVTPSVDSFLTSVKPLWRACDCCRKRKIKCNGGNPCAPCKKASIRCAYLQSPKKKGPRGLRSARVLHTLRRIDNDAIAHSPGLPNSPDSAFANWGWEHHGCLPFTSQIHRPPHFEPMSVPSGQPYFPMTPSMPSGHPHGAAPAPGVNGDGKPMPWPKPPGSTTTNDDTHSSMSSETLSARLPGLSFVPYIRLFFSYMFPIMPVIDQTVYLDPAFCNNSQLWSVEQYCMLCAICAMTIVQLDASIPQPPPLHPTKSTDEIFAAECLRERENFDFVENTSPLNVMASYFLFAYHGNKEKHAKAWYYLQECISFVENLNMEDEATYAKLEPNEEQWSRRLYWLLFVTERAYAVQRRKHTRLAPSVQLPAIFESEDPLVLNGFVNLANLFAAVDDNFVRAWRGSRRQSLCNEEWLIATQKQIDAAAMALDNIPETQQLDISVTREWLHVLAWQMGVSNGLIWSEGEHGMRLDYPIDLAKKVIDITSGTNAQALDSHGIGMEQKLADIAGCLADVLRCTAGDTSPAFTQGKHYLNILVQQLSSMRGKESRYLKPLMAKTEGLIDFPINNPSFPLTSSDKTHSNGELQPPSNPQEYFRGRTMSMADSVGLLRSMSMSGTLGMPTLSIPVDDWMVRGSSRPSLSPAEAAGIQNWSFGGPSIAT